MSIETSIGGAATNHGIWYQALWCVLCAVETKIECIDDGLRIILEPYGGDTWLERPDGRQVVQLKTLSEGTWSLKNVVEEVLPDLYRAVSLDSPTTTKYEFVTEGGMGNWTQVRESFESLAQRVMPDVSESEFNVAYNKLDNIRRLKFGGSSGEFWNGARTQHQLFNRIVDHLRTKSPACDETIEQTRWKTWHLLARFRFKGLITESQIRRQLRELLLQYVDHRESVTATLNAMVAWLINRSSANEVTTTPKQLFESCNLKYVLPIGQWAATKERCQNRFLLDTKLRKYRPEWDVRFRQSNCESSSAHTPFIVVFGGSGLGKSWWLCAQSYSSDTLATVMLDSKGDAEVDLQRAANRVWRDSLGHDADITLQSLANRREDVFNKPSSEPWLKICLDQLTSIKEAHELLCISIEDWGVQLIISCDEQVAQVFEEYQQESPDRVQIVHLERFTVTERDEYLQRRLGNEWVKLPADVRELLRNPQLAGLYCEVSKDLGEWQPRSEYDLLEKFWRRLTTGKNTEYRRDALHFCRLAVTILDNKPYPWGDEQLEIADITESATRRLSSLGWLRLNENDFFEVPHIRLLNFAVAKELIIRHRDQSMSDKTIADLLHCMLDGHTRFSGVMLSYVPMDWFFLRLKDGQTAAEQVLTLFAEELNYHTHEVFYSKLLPTIGFEAVSPLVNRLVTLAVECNWIEIKSVVNGLSTRPTGELRESILNLLEDDRPRVQRAALILIARKPIPEVLDKVWQLHIKMQTNPHLFFEDDISADRKTGIWLYDDSFSALRECARLEPSWVAMAIRRANPETEPVHVLAYLTANLNDEGKIWQSCKAELFKKVPSDKRRSLALNIGKWRDNSEMNRLKLWVDIEKDLLGPTALRAIAQIDPTEATIELAKLPENELYACRHWHLPRLLLTAASETHKQLRQVIEESADPLTTFLIYQDNENEMDTDTLNLLLKYIDEALGDLLVRKPHNKSDSVSLRNENSNSLYIPMTMLASIGRYDLLEVFEAQRETSFEYHLEELLTTVIHPRGSLWQDNLMREPSINVLRKIGGKGIERVATTFLDADTQFGKLDAIKEALPNAGNEAIEKINRIALSYEQWDDTSTPLLQMESMRALATLGDGNGVLSSALRLGMNVPSDIRNWLQPNTRPDEEAIEEAVRIVRDREKSRLPGALIALGLFGCVKAVDEMTEVLRNPLDETARLSAIVGLGQLGESADPAVNLIGECIMEDKLRHAVVVALSRIGTVAARMRLLESLEDSWDTSLAIWLTRFQTMRAQLITQLTKRLKSRFESINFFRRGDTDIILAEADDDVLSEVLTSLPIVCDDIREAAFSSEGSSWIVGSKKSAIRGLAVFDCNAACLAASTALKNIDAHDRHLYPALLSRLNADEAREVFAKLAPTEKNDAVLWSMAQAMRTEDLPWLFDQLTATSNNCRLAACHLATGIALDDKSIRVKLLEMLTDSEEQVANAAEQSLHLIRQQQRAAELADELAQENNELCVKHWVLLDSALQVGHCGYKGTQWPEWALRFINSNTFKAHPALMAEFQKRIAENRKTLLQKVKH